tara:strand:- start:104 stop:379 length:276 start_codon:yes stop_codon:yes gene_type:complete
MSTKDLKISEEQLQTVKNQQNAKSRVLTDIGVVEAQKHDLLHALANVMEKVNETAEELEKEYGKININLEDGTYEEIVVEEEVKKEVKEEK